MKDSLGNRHLDLAANVNRCHRMDTDILEGSIARTWTRPMSDSSRDFCDFTSAISGDDLARINAFEPKDPNLKPIGEQRGIWSDVRHDPEAQRRARAARKAAA